MEHQKLLKGFSRLSRDQKVQWLSQYVSQEDLPDELEKFRMTDSQTQSRFESFSENTLSNYHLPWGIVPNVLIDGQLFHVPVVTEESSVVAAASKAASFWAQRGGFQTLQLSTLKRGQLHFTFSGSAQELYQAWTQIAPLLQKHVSHLTTSMEQRGGGIKALHLKQIPGLPNDYFQIDMEAETMDSMGANFINSILEEAGRALPDLVADHTQGHTQILMAILSNYTPECVVKMQLKAPIQSLDWHKEMPPEVFAKKMQWASDIAWHDVSRAVTHNKGIYNGIDAVVLATGNDFRAVEAAGHAFAARNGTYRSLSKVEIQNESFTLWMEVPLALGTVGGLTRLHPLAEKTLRILGEPDAKTLMKLAAAVGLANNFAAMASLVTTGIQQGHMKMHLQNILNALEVQPSNRKKAEEYFKDKNISVAAVKEYIASLQKNEND